MGINYCFITVDGDQVKDVELHNCISKHAAFDIALVIIDDHVLHNIDFDRVEIWDCSGEGFVIGLTNM